MVTFKAATCPACAGALQVPDNRSTIKCMYCGVNVIVREAIHAAAVGNIQNWLMLANTAAVSGNYQEAYSYFTRILEVDSDCIDAWLGKGEAAARLSAPQYSRIPEMCANVATAVELVNSENEAAVKARAAESIYRCSGIYYQLIRQRIQRNISSDAAWGEFMHQSGEILTGLEKAYKYTPKDKRIIEGIILVCKDLLTGGAYYDPYMRDHKKRPMLRTRAVPGDYAVRVNRTLAHYAGALRELTPAPPPGHTSSAEPSAYDALATYLSS